MNTEDLKNLPIAYDNKSGEIECPECHFKGKQKYIDITDLYAEFPYKWEDWDKYGWDSVESRSNAKLEHMNMVFHYEQVRDRLLICTNCSKKYILKQHINKIEQQLNENLY